MPARAAWMVPALCVAVALVLRVGFSVSQPDFRPASDAADFDRIAVSLAVDGTYPPSQIAPDGGPSAFRPPAYPHLLGALYRVTGQAGADRRFVLARLLSAMLSTLAVALLGLVAWLVWGRAAAIAGMAIAAVYPPLVSIGDAMLSEPLFIALVLAAVACALMCRRSERPLGWALAVGALVGVAALARTNGIVVAPFLVAAIWRSPRLSARSAATAGAALIVVAIVLAPWAVRNTRVFDRFVPLTTQAGFTLAGTYNDPARADRERPAAWRVPTMAPYDRLRASGGNEAVLEQRFRAEAVAYARRHPPYVAKVIAFNTMRLLDLRGPGTERPAATESGISGRVSDVDVYAFYVLALLALLGAAAGGLRGMPVSVWLVPVAMAISLVPVIAYMRYRLPIDPFLIVIVAGAVAHQRLRGVAG